MKSIKITKEMIHSRASAKGGWTKPQLTALGVPWPKGGSPPPGWLKGLDGTNVSMEDWEAFARIPVYTEIRRIIPGG